LAARRGFTLIELMVVMALVAVAVGLVTLSLRDPASAQLDREAVRHSWHGDEGANAVGGQREVALTQAQHDALRADQRLRPERQRATADDLGAHAVAQPLRGHGFARHQADEAKAGVF